MAVCEGGLQNLARETPGKGASPWTPATSTMVAARSRRADRFLDDLRRTASTWRDHEERDVQLRLVEARAVAEDAGMFAETLAVVRGDDQPRLLEDPASLQLVDQLPELLVEVRDAIVVGVDGEGHPLG